MKKIISLIFMFIISLSLCSAALTDSNDAYYTLDNTLNDATTNNYDLTNNGATYTTSGKINGAYNFDGTNDYMLNSDSVLSDSAGSISMWINADTVDTTYAFASSAGSNSRVYVFTSSGRIFFGRGDQGNIDTGVTVSTGTWYHCVLTWTSSGYKTYVNAVNKNTGSYSIGTSMSTVFGLGSFNQNGESQSSYFDGRIDEVSIWTRQINQTEIDYLYASGSPGETQQYPYVVFLNRTIEQQYTQTQLTPISINGTEYVDILSGSFNVSQNDTLNYGSSTLNLQSNDSNSLVCRVNIDGNNGTEYKYDTIPDIVSTMVVSRGNITLDEGQHNITLECKKEGPGEIEVAFAKGIGHLLKSKDGNEVNYLQANINGTSTGGSSYTNMGTVSFTTEGSKTDLQKFLVIDWTSEVNNSYVSDEELNTYLSINNFNCTKFNFTVNEALVKNTGSSCLIQAEASKEYNISFYGTGNNASYDTFLNIKELDLVSTEASYDTFNNISFTNTTLLYSYNITNSIENANLYFRAASTVRNNGSIGSFYVNITGTDFLQNSTEMFKTFFDDNSFLISEDSIPVPTGLLEIDVYGLCPTNETCYFDDSEITTYMAENLQFENNTFTIKAYNQWNSSQIQDFSVSTKGSTINSTGGEVTIFTDDLYLDLLIESEGYIDRYYTNYDTSTDLDAQLYQSVVNINATELYTLNYVSNFSIDINGQNFSTTNGTITIYPNLGDYNFNATFDDYFNITYILLNVTSSLFDYTITGVHDTRLNFFDSVTVEQIYPVCSYNGTILDMTNYSLNANSVINRTLSCNLVGYNNLTTVIPATSLPQNLSYNLNRTTLTIKAFDLNDVSEQLTFNLTLSNSTTTLTYLNQLNFQKNYNETINGEFEAVIEVAGYSTVRYYNTLSPYTSINLIAYPSNTTDTVTFFTTDSIKDKALDNVTIEVQRNINGSLVTIAQAVTGSDGRGYVFLDVSQEEYTFIFTKNNYRQAIVTSIPGVISYSVRLEEIGVEFDFFTDINTIFYPGAGILYYNSTYEMKGFITGTSFTLINYEIFDQDNNLIYNSSSINPTGSSFKYNLLLNDTNITSITQRIQYYRNGEVYIESKEYKVMQLTDSFITYLKNNYGNLDDDTNSIFRWIVIILSIGGSYLIAQQLVGAGGIGSVVFISFFTYISWIPTPIGAVLAFGALVLWLGGRR